MHVSGLAENESVVKNGAVPQLAGPPGQAVEHQTVHTRGDPGQVQASDWPLLAAGGGQAGQI